MWIFFFFFKLHTPSRSLCSSADSHVFPIRHVNFKGSVHFVMLVMSSGTCFHFLFVMLKPCCLEHAPIFCSSCSNLVVWNRLPFSVCHAQTLLSGIGSHFCLSCSNPVVWNRLPLSVRHAQTLLSGIGSHFLFVMLKPCCLE